MRNQPGSRFVATTPGCRQFAVPCVAARRRANANVYMTLTSFDCEYAALALLIRSVIWSIAPRNACAHSRTELKEARSQRITWIAAPGTCARISSRTLRAAVRLL